CRLPISKPSSTIWPRSCSMRCPSDCGRAPATSPGSSSGWICATDRPRGSPRWSGPRGRDVLDLEELLDPDLSALTAETRHLHTSEGCAGIRDQARVESDHARFEPVGQAERTLEVLAEQVAGQPEFGLIGQSDRLVVGVEGDDRCDGSEDLGGADLAVGGHIGDDGGIEEEALALDPLAAEL